MNHYYKYGSFLFLWLILTTWILGAQTTDKNYILIENVKVFDSKKKKLSGLQNVLIEGNTIVKVGQTLPEVDTSLGLRIDGKGHTLIPGLIDVHVHLIFGSLTMMEMLNPELSEDYIFEKASIQAEQMILRGFTSVRDVGGPSFGLKKAIDEGKVLGPRVWACGPVISQTSGHGDFRLPHERSRRFFGPISRAEIYGASFIADGRDEVLTAVRENLKNGASFIKLMAGGGTSSAYDPVDVTQYTLDEMRAAVEAAEDWGTYVTVHAYTSRAVRRAVDAGVRCIEHGQMLDESTIKYLKRKKVWLSLQNLMESTPNMDPQRLEKRKPIIEGQDKVWNWVKKHKIPVAWGTDVLFEPELQDLQNQFIVKMNQWFTPSEILQILTYNNAQVLALSGLRSPYQGALGVIQEKALADMILVKGDPTKDLHLLTKPHENFLLILKDGKIVKKSSALD